MAVNRRCSRAWRWLTPFAGLVGALGCAQPGPNAGYSLSDSGASPLLSPAELASEFAKDTPQEPLCGDPLLAGDFPIDESGLPTLYVDGASDAAAPDGSRNAPFRTIGEALAAEAPGTVVPDVVISNSGAPRSSAATPGSGAALGATRRVLVADGYYEEDVAIPPGTLLLGGYDAARWEQGAGLPVIGGSVYVGTATPPASIVTTEGALSTGGAVPSNPSAVPLAALRHFEVANGVEIMPGARALLRDNLIAPVLYRATLDPPDYRRAIGVAADSATLRADHNRLVLPASNPAGVIGLGFYVSDSCAWVTENEIADYRSPISFYGGAGVAATFNQIERGQNGVCVGGNQALIAANSLQLSHPSVGCVYAVYMDDGASPDIRHNSILLNDLGNRGLTEAQGASHPIALLGNRFFSPQWSPVLYAVAHQDADPELIVDIGKVNSLPDVPEVGGNTFMRVPTAP